jgi:alkaline phosphatase
MKKLLSLVLLLLSIQLIAQTDYPTGNVIFIHPDGTGLASWNATRILFEGPDGMLNWDRIPNVGFYRSHMSDVLTSTSHSGATVHAYGVKVKQDSYGMNGTEPVTALSGKNKSIMQEAMEAGIRVGLVNTGSVIEPGSAVFVASTESRRNSEEITKQVIESGADVIFCGGEEWMLPKGVKGVHAFEGRRTDGVNLIEKAQELGYVVIYDKDQLAELPRDVSSWCLCCQSYI